MREYTVVLGRSGAEYQVIRSIWGVVARSPGEDPLCCTTLDNTAFIFNFLNMFKVNIEWAMIYD